MVKICEVVDGCEDCPKYGDDCDGDKMTEHTDLISRAAAVDACCRGWNNTAEDCIRNIKKIPSAKLPKGDLISRAEVIGIVEDYISKDYMTPLSRLYSVRSELSALPSANCIEFDFNKYPPRVRNKVNDGTPLADAVQGEWIYDHHNDEHTCSVCGRKALCDDYVGIDWQMEVLSDYCPSCGARMKGGAE